MPFLAILFVILLASLVGGVAARLLKLTPMVGYIVFGMIFGKIFHLDQLGIEKITEVGIILLLFSIGLELPISRLIKTATLVPLGAFLQVILVSLFSYLCLGFFGIFGVSAFVLAVGFSLSSTAVVVKILSERGEARSVPGEVMITWLLIQDLLSILFLVFLPFLLGSQASGYLLPLGKILIQVLLMAGVGLALGKLIVPFLVRKVAYLNSRELLILMAVTLAIAVSYLASLLGISPALGAFLAGIIIADSQENHEIFAETRPLRDLFVALFFVSLGFLITPGTIINNLPLVAIVTCAVLIIKFVVVLVLSTLIGNHIKTAIYSSFGLAQVGEFAIIIYSGASGLGLISQNTVSLGVSVALLSLIITPFLFKWSVPFWKKVREYSQTRPWLSHLIFKRGLSQNVTEKISDHIVVCGYGRVGGWVGKALSSLSVTYVVIDYDQKVVDQLKSRGIPVIYGDPIQPEILEAAQIAKAKAVVIAIPDRVAQEELIMLLNRKYPNIHIIGRAHFDEDVERLKLLEVDKVVQPEFEAAVAIVKSILTTMGKSKEEINQKITSLRLSRAKT